MHRDRPAQADPGGLGESPDGTGDAEVIEMGGHPPPWPWGTARGPAISLALTALAAGLLLGFAAGRLQAGANGRPARAASARARSLSPASLFFSPMKRQRRKWFAKS